MLARAQRIAKKDFPALLKEPHGKFFCSTHTLLARRAPSLQFAPVFPRKCKLSSVEQHYWRRRTYHALHDVLRAHPHIAETRLRILLLAQPSFLSLTYQETVATITSTLLKLIASTPDSPSQQPINE